MKTILGSRRDRSLAKFGIFLIVLALIGGTGGCDGKQYNLIISSTEHGEVMRPGEGNFTRGEGVVVSLVAKPDEGYRFVNWAGDVDTIADVNAAATNITMDDDYSISANFALEILEIRDWYELHAVRDDLGGSYILMNNLDSTTANYTELASPTANGGKGWEPIGTWSRRFTGSFDGRGCEIRDLFINRPDESYVGLFGYVDRSGVVKDIGVVNASVTGKDDVGGLVGKNDEATVSESYCTGNVTGKDGAGGLVGWNQGTVGKSSYFTGNVSGDSRVGGLVGRNEGTVSSSDSTGTVKGNHNVGGLVGINQGGTVSTCHSTANVTSEKGSYIGGLVGRNYGESTVCDSYSAGSVSGDVGVGGLVGFNDKSTVSNSHYNYDEVLINGQNVITAGALFSEDFERWLTNGEFLELNERLSQEDGYYVVNNVSDFKELLAFGQNSLLKFRLTDDLDLANEANFYIPYFAGEFDGNGHKISNLSFNFTFPYNVGLFGYLARGGIVSRVGVENVGITGASRLGGLVGANWEGIVSTCHSTGDVTSEEGSYVGGLVGYNYGESTVSNSSSRGSVSGESYVGGLVGYNKWTVSTCHFTGNVTSEGSYIGGLVGWNGHKVSESHSTSNVTGNDYVGGLVGKNDEATVSESYCTGNVTGKDGAGGLVGWNQGTVETSYSTGSVNGSNEDVGGLVGYNEGGTVSNSYSTSSVCGDLRVGGLVGRNKDKDEEGIVNSSYSTGTVSGKKDVGGLVAVNIDGTVSSSFWDIETSGQATSAGGTGKNTTEMKTTDTFRRVGWNIVAVTSLGDGKTAYTWNVVDGQTYPFLSWQFVS